MSTIEIKQYPIIDQFEHPEPYLNQQVKDALTHYGFFYIKDSIEARVSIDKELESLKESVDVYYGEDADTGEGSVFHGTYSRLDSPNTVELNQYFNFVSQVLEIISRAFGYPAKFLEEFSQQKNYGLYIYDREEEYMKSINKIRKEDISIPPHKDRSLITILISIKGFEGYKDELGWFSIPDKEHYLIVQAGTLLQDLTQNTIKANIHQVRGYDSSKALFWGNLVPV